MLVDTMTSRFHYKTRRWQAWVVKALFSPIEMHCISPGWQRSLKRLFPLLILISFIAVLFLDNFNPAIAQLPHREIRGVWMTSNDFNTIKDRDKVQDALSQLRRLNFNTIYPVVWNSGYVA